MGIHLIARWSRLARKLVPVIGGAALVGCAGLPSAQSPQLDERNAPKVLKVETERLVVMRDEALTVSQLFERGQRELLTERAQAAELTFERVLQLDPNGPFIEDALFEGARAREAQTKFSSAAERFEEVARRFPRGEYAREALFRAIRLRAQTDEFVTAGADARAYSERYADFGPREEVVVAGARALAAVAQNNIEGAEYYIAKGRHAVSDHQLDAAGEIPRDVALLYFALGEVRRLKGEQIGFTPFPANFADVFEARAQLLIDAEAAYSDAMRAYDAHWSTMAGYRIAELYQRLHTDVMTMPRPPGADTPRREQLFDAAVHMRYAVLLRKGVNMIEHTLAMAGRSNEQSSWVERAREAQRSMQASLKQEEQTIEAAPVSRLDLAAVLHQMQREKPQAQHRAQ